jgi:hypothetical protein
MNHYKFGAVATVLSAALTAPLAAVAGPTIGLDATGTGTYTTYADLWTNVTDSALVTGFVPGATVSSAGSQYLTELRTQTKIGTMSNSNTGSLVTPAGLNSSFEITKVVRFQELVTSQNATTATFGMAPSQSAAMDVDAAHAGVQNFALYFDRITTGGPSVSVAGNGAGTVRCYGAGSTGGLGNGCGGGADADGDGIMILSGHLVFNTASFTAGGAVGTGSFDTRFMIDYVDAAYLDIVTGSIFGDTFTGTTNVPSFFAPSSMWDGTTAGSVPYLKLDSSQSFAAVPEPGTLAIMGLGLAGLALGKRRKVTPCA